MRAQGVGPETVPSRWCTPRRRSCSCRAFLSALASATSREAPVSEATRFGLPRRRRSYRGRSGADRNWCRKWRKAPLGIALGLPVHGIAIARSWCCRRWTPKLSLAGARSSASMAKTVRARSSPATGLFAWLSDQGAHRALQPLDGWWDTASSHDFPGMRSTA